MLKPFFLILGLALLFQACHSDHAHDDHDHEHDETHAIEHSHDHNHGHHESDEHEHHHHGNLAAHTHGEMSLSIAVDGRDLVFQLSGPSEALIGFEHAPKTDKEKQVWEQLKTDWDRSKLMEVFQFSEELNCHTHNSTVNIRTGDGHAEIDIDGHIMCQEGIYNTELKSNLMERYERLHKLRIDVLPTTMTPYSRTFEHSQQIVLEL